MRPPEILHYQNSVPTVSLQAEFSGLLLQRLVQSAIAMTDFMCGPFPDARVIYCAYPDIAKGDTGAVVLQQNIPGLGLEEILGEMILGVCVSKQFGLLAVRSGIDDNINGLPAVEPEAKPTFVVAGRFKQNAHLVPLARFSGKVIGRPNQPVQGAGTTIAAKLHVE